MIANRLLMGTTKPAEFIRQKKAHLGKLDFQSQRGKGDIRYDAMHPCACQGSAAE